MFKVSPLQRFRVCSCGSLVADGQNQTPVRRINEYELATVPEAGDVPNRSFLPGSAWGLQGVNLFGSE